jgi:hypothetical protein
MWTTNLVNLTTGAGIHSWQAAPGMNVVVSGVPTASLNTCISPPGTGAYTYRTTGWDMAGNAQVYDFTLYFDVTPPAITAPTSGGTAVNDGRVFGSATGYRPPMAWTISDAHSGVASYGVKIDGQAVAASLSGSTVSMTPAAKLALGAHSVSITVTDTVGNTATVTRSITIVDDAKPTLTIDAPGASGDNTPVLDVTAADDMSGVNATTWTVLVNGVALPASSTSSRLQVSLGRLVNGTHTIEVRIADNSGNQQTKTVTYTATGDTYTPPGLTGIFVLQSPSEVNEGDSYHVVAIATKAGRPIVTGRYEASKIGSPDVLAGKSTTSDGSVDLLVENAVEGPMQLALTGSSLTAATYSYTFHAKGTPPFCDAHPTDPSCRTTTGTGGGAGTDGTGGSGGSGGGGDGNGTSGGSTGTTSLTNPTGGTDAGTSGGPNDKVPPKFVLKASASKPGVLKRTKTLVLRMTSNERANYTVQPVGNTRATKVAMTTKAKVLKIKLTGALLKRIQNSKAKVVVVKVRVVGIDPNKNTTRKTITLRIRR